METYILHMRRAALNKVKMCMSAHIENDTWLTVKELGDLVGTDLADIFGGTNLGWSPTALLYRCQITEMFETAAVSMPKPEEIPDTASSARVDPMIALRGAVCFLRHWVDAGNRVHMPVEIINQLSEMRTLIHALIGTGENCNDEPDNEYPEAVRKATRLDAMDAFCYAIRTLLDRKDVSDVKSAINSIYGTATYEGARLDDTLKHAEKSYAQTFAKALNVNPEEQDDDNDHLHTHEPENIRDDEQNALFITIETGTFDPTLENVEAVRAFISDAGEGRDIHLRII